MNSDQGRTLPALPAIIDRDSDCASASDLDKSFPPVFLRFPHKFKTIGNNWNTIGTIAILLLGALRIPRQ